ncbi:MAG: hypothetical protein M3480_01900 [Verrucomicrobiota bacterium]|nr:hypothetical protein [Verrucomicrobiota bacterium]
MVDADLAQYFDTIPDRKLLRQVARRVSDGMILKLIKGWLRAPVVQEHGAGGRKMIRRKEGTPQVEWAELDLFYRFRNFLQNFIPRIP